MAEYTTIVLDAGGPVARITLNRPEKRNPIGPQTCGELVHALGQLKASEAVRVIVLTGAGTVFSAGGDLSAMQQAPAASAVAPKSLVELLVAMHELGKPIVAM